MQFTKLEPKIWKIVQKSEKDAVGYDLVYVDDRYIVKSKLYGIVNKLIPRIVKLIALKLFKHISIIATGGKGLGKTSSMNMIANLLLDVGIPVVEIKYLEIETKLIDFLSDFKNVCIIIDEFGKCFKMEHQDKMLTLLNQKSEHYTIFILGDNEIRNISTFILDRMERIKYHMHLSRVSNSDLREWGADHSIRKDIIDSLVSINATSNKLSYDTLEAIEVESKLFPELKFDELVEVMNIKGILGIPIMNILDISLVDNDDYYVSSHTPAYSNDKVRHSRFMANEQSIYLNVVLKKIKEETTEETPKPTSQNPNMFNPYNHASTTGINTTVKIGAGDIVDIDDLDNVITAKVKVNDYTFKVLLNTKVIAID